MSPATENSPPGDLSATFHRARALHAQGQLDGARALYESVLAREPANADALHLLGLLHLQCGELERAETLMRQALTQRPDFMRAHSNLGAVLMSQQRPEEARDAFRAALDLDPDDEDVRFNLGTAAQALGLFDEAVARYREVLHRSPDAHEARLNLGTALRQAGKIEAAVETFTEVVERAPGVPEAHFNLGIALKGVGRLDAACEAFRRTLQIQPTYVDAAFNLGTTLQQLGQLDESAQAFRQALSLSPDLARAHYALGTVLRDGGNLEPALEEFQQAAAAGLDDVNTRHAIGLTRLQLGDPRGALQAFDHILTGTPDSTRELAYKGVALDLAGEVDALRELVDFERFLQGVDVDVVEGYASVSAFNDALAAYVQSHPTLRQSPDGFATRNGLHSLELLEGEEQPVPGLRAMIERAVKHYISSHPRDPSHPFLLRPPERWRLTAWAVVMESQGHQVAHIHPTAWLSGVYYVKVPPGVSPAGEGHAGWIEFGRPDSIFPLDEPTQLRQIRPEPGKMVLFPGYFHHRTIPLEGDQRRICVAFDVVREP